MVPRAAVQVIGDRSVIYLADATADGRFIEREVRLGAATDDQVEIVSGIQPGDSVVVQRQLCTACRAEASRVAFPAAGPLASRPRRACRKRRE